MSEKEYIENRFPHFKNLFVFDTNQNMVGVNNTFRWNDYAYTDVLLYIKSIVRNCPHIGNYKNCKDFNYKLTQL